MPPLPKKHGHRARTALGHAQVPEVDLARAREGDLLGGRYRLSGVIGEGGMGEVWEARQTDLDRRVAIKLLRHAEASTERMQRFVREAHVVADFHHPNVVPVIAAGWHEGRPYLVMPLLQGTDLGRILERRGRLPLEDALELLVEVARGVDALHEAGIVHRDIKPENIFIGSHGAVQILDFGLATLAQLEPDRRLTRQGLVLGTPEYIAPELARGMAPGPAADVYALAVVGYELLTGALPFDEANTVELLVAKSQRRAPSLASKGYAAPAPVERAFSRALERAPEDRFPTAQAFVEALVEGQTSAEVQQPDALTEPPDRGRHRTVTEAEIPSSSSVTVEPAASPRARRRRSAQVAALPVVRVDTAKPARRSSTGLVVAVGLLALAVCGVIVWIALGAW